MHIRSPAHKFRSFTDLETLFTYHTGKVKAYSSAHAELSRDSSRIFYARSLLFVLAVILFIYFFKPLPSLSFGILALTVIAFLFLLNREVKLRRRSTFLKNLIQIHETELKILQKDFSGSNEGTEFLDKSHPFIADLDIFGKRSIFQLLNRTSTYTGRQKLAQWLSAPFLGKDVICQRQQAVKELASGPERAYQFIATGAENKEKANDKEQIREWLNEENYFSGSALAFLCIALPVITISVLILGQIGIIESDLAIGLFLVQLMIIGGYTRRINKVHDNLSRKFDSIEKYRKLISLIEKEKFESVQLNDLRSRLGYDERSAESSIAALKKLTDLLDARMNIVVALMLNGFLLWDLNVMRRIEKWRTKHKSDFDRWIDVIGEFDAFTSLAMYAHNNPSYAYPEISDDLMMEGQAMGHPMINEENLVRNDYSIKGKPKVDLLTGANMAGKSTFLRTVGVNLTLAMIGAPVCAERYKFHPIHLFTSLRTNDSLQENESFFYAELKRLHQLVERYEKGEQVFFLLDEILKGTNSKDQHSGSVALIKKILKLNGIGIVATHDVELSGLANEYPDNIRNLCFEIQIKDNKLDFSYKLSTGVCSTMNASFLMKQMGIVD